MEPADAVSKDEVEYGPGKSQTVSSDEDTEVGPELRAAFSAANDLMRGNKKQSFRDRLDHRWDVAGYVFSLTRLWG
jgi:hypothetical protein